jgi:hypothetical protein
MPIQHYSSTTGLKTSRVLAELELLLLFTMAAAGLRYWSLNCTRGYLGEENWENTATSQLAQRLSRRNF